MGYLQYDARRFFLFGMRFFFGSWLMYAGLVKWVGMGASNFVGYIKTAFENTWSPEPLNFALGWLIVIAEPLLALLILWGRHPRFVWTLTTLLMFLLTIGQTILMKPEVVGNWQYLIMALVCAALHDPEPSASSKHA